MNLRTFNFSRRLLVKVFATVFLLMCIVAISFWLGILKGRYDQKVGEVLIHELALPITEVRKFENKTIGEEREYLERRIDLAIIDAIECRHSPWASKKTRTNVDDILTKALAHKEQVGFAIDLEDLKPEIREKLKNTRETLAPRIKELLEDLTQGQ
jgi:hypothetical protein